MSHSYSGDVTLTGEQETPVAIKQSEDVFVRRDSVDGALELRDVEYVFAGQAATDSVSVGSPSQTYTGDIEDGYISDVRGDAVVAGADDVFLAHGAASRVDAVGAEQVFHDADADPVAGIGERVMGWQQSRTLSAPDHGVALYGAGHEVTVTNPPSSLTLYVLGYDHEVRVEGGRGEVAVHFVGRDNTVTTSPYVDVSVAGESGFDNTATADPVPHEDVIETTKDEAFGSVTFGRARVTYQVPASDEEWCPGCGAAAEAVVKRRYRDALFVFGHPVYTFEVGGRSYDCESCAPPAATLTESQRQDALR